MEKKSDDKSAEKSAESAEKSADPKFDMDEDRTYLNTIIHIRNGFEMSESMSELICEEEC